MSARHFGFLLVNILGWCLCTSIAPAQPGAHIETAALVKEQVTLSGGTVEGNVQLTAPLSFTINTGFAGDGFLLLPGVPDLQLHRRSTVGVIEEGEGSVDPSGYAVRLQARADLPGIRTRVDPPDFPVVSPPPVPAGELDLRLASGEVFDGDFADIRNLTLATDAGPFYLPPGHYGDLHIQRGARLVIGVEGEWEPSTYSFTSIHCYPGALMDLLGPVAIETESFPRPVTEVLGNPARPEWLLLGIATGDWTLDRGALFYGTVIAPHGGVILQSTSSFCGQIFARELVLNASADLRFCPPSNHRPLAEDVAVTTIRGQPVSFQLLGFDQDGDDLSYLLLNLPEHGELSGEAPGLTYTPFNGFAGEEVLRYAVFDGEIASEEATVTIAVEAVNHPPFFTSLPPTEVDERSSYAYEITGGDFDIVHGDHLVLTAEVLPQWLSLLDHGDGTATLSGDPERPEVGEHTVVLRVTDSEGAFAEQVFSLVVHYVNQAPLAEGTRLSLVRYGELDSELAPFASDPDGDSLSFEVIAGPRHGSLQFFSDGTLTYAPEWGFFGEDGFSYRVSDGELQSEEAVVRLEVGFLNYPPVAEAQEVFTQEGTPVEVVLAATDFDGDDLSYTIATGPGSGALGGTAPALTYTPDAGFYGFDSFSFVASDGYSDSEAAIVGIEVNARPRVNVLEPQTGDTFIAPAKVYFKIEAGDPDGTAGSIVLYLDGQPLAQFDNAPVIFEWEATTPGVYAFHAVAADDRGGIGESDVTEILVRENHAPVASDQEVQAIEDTGAEFILEAGDPDGDELQLVLLEGPVAGALDIVESGAQVRLRYTPEPAFVGADAFVYRVSDGLLESNQARVDLDVIPDPNRIFVTLTADKPDVTAVGRPILPRYAIIANHDEWALSDHGFGEAPTVENFARNIVRSFSPLRAGTFLAYSDDLAYTGSGLRNMIESEGHEWVVTTNLDHTLDRLLEFDGLFLLDRAIHSELLGEYVAAGGSVYLSGDGTTGSGERWNAFLSAHGLAFDPLENAVAGAIPVSSNQPLLDGVTSLYASLGNDVSVADGNMSGIIHSQGENNLIGVYNPPGGEWRDYVILVEAAYETVAEEDLTYEWKVVSGDPEQVRFVIAEPGLLAVQFLAEATIEVEFWVTDGERERRRTIELSGRNPVPPSIVSEPPKQFVAFRNSDRKYAYPLEVEAGEGEVRFLLEEAPEGASLDARTGLLEWEIGYGNEGLYHFSVTVLDRIDSVATQNWTVEVIDNQPPVIFMTERVLAGALDRQTILAALVSDATIGMNDLVIEWRQIVGPAGAVLISPSQAETAVSFSEPGFYLFELAVSDGDFVSTDSVEVYVGDSWEGANPPGLAAWWTGNHTALEAITGIAANLSSGTTFTSEGMVHGALDFDGATSGMVTPAGEALDIAAQGEEGSFSVEFWIAPGRIASDERIVEWRDAGANRNGVSLAMWGSSQMILRLVDVNGSVTSAVSASGFITLNQWSHLAVTYDHDRGLVTFYRNGVFHSHRAIARRVPQTSLDLYIGYREPGSNYFQGRLDELSLYSRALRAEEVSYVHGLGEAGKSPPVSNVPPLVSAGPDVFLSDLDDSLLLEGSVEDDNLPFGELTTQWRKISGPGSVFFAEASAGTHASFTQSGLYILELEADDGMFVTRDRMTARVAMPCESVNPAGLAAWWPWNGTLDEAIQNLGAFRRRHAMEYADGIVSSGLVFDGARDGLLVERAPSLDIGREGDFSIEFWLNPSQVASDLRILEWRDADLNQNGVSLALWGSSQMLLRIVDASGSSTAASSHTGLVAASQWRHVAVTYQHDIGLVTFYRNGVFYSQQTVSKRLPQTSLDLYIGYRDPDLNHFHGVLDELSLYSRALDAHEISLLHGRGHSGKCQPGGNAAPEVSAGPDLFLDRVGDVTLADAVAADDGLPFGEVAVQWRQISGPAPALFADSSKAATSVAFAEPGLYVLELEANDGMYFPRDRTTVRVALPCVTENPPGLAAWWPWNGELDETIHGLDTAPRKHAMEFGAGAVSTGLAFDGLRDGLSLERSPELDIGTSGNFSVEFWTRPSRIVSDERILEWHDAGSNRNGVSLVHWGSSQMLLRIYDAGGSLSSASSASGLVAVGQWRHIAVTYSHDLGLVTFYRNGAFHSQQSVTRRLPETSLDFHIGYRHPNSNYFQGTLDELSLYNRTLRSEEVHFVAGRGAAGKCPPSPNLAPVVAAGPDLIVNTLEDAAFLDGSAVDDGLPFRALAVEWRKMFGPGEAAFGDFSQATTTVSFSEPGLYVLELEADDGMYVVRDRISVRAGLSCEVENPPGLAAWWSWNGILHEGIQGLHTIPRRHSMDYQDAIVSSGLVFDGSGDGLLVERAPSLDVGGGGSFSIEFWTRPSRVNSGEQIVQWRDAAGNRSGVSLAHWGSSQLLLTLMDSSGSSSSAASATGLLAASHWRHVTVTYDHDLGLVTFYRNGAFYSQQAVTRRLPETSLDLYIGYQDPNRNLFQGVLDELSLYRGALAAAEVEGLYGLGAAGKCPVDPEPAPVAASDDSDVVMVASKDSGYDPRPEPAPLSVTAGDDEGSGDGGGEITSLTTSEEQEGERWVFQEGLELILTFDDPDGAPGGSVVLRFLGESTVEIAASGQTGLYTYSATADTEAVLEIILSHEGDEEGAVYHFEYYKLLLKYATGDEGSFEGWLVLDDGEPQRQSGTFVWP